MRPKYTLFTSSNPDAHPNIPFGASECKEIHFTHLRARPVENIYYSTHTEPGFIKVRTCMRPIKRIQSE